VTNVSGSSVPKAIVVVDSNPVTKSLTFEADANGNATLELLSRNYDLLVKSQGFRPFKLPLSFQNQSSLIVEAKLQIDNCPGPSAGPCMTVTWKGPTILVETVKWQNSFPHFPCAS
jgi:hypothetical protein